MTDKPFPTEAQIAAALAAAKARPELTEIYFVACGGSYALMLPNQYAVDRHAKTIAGHALNAAEFLARNPARLGPSSAVILSSHSGTTPETVEAARFARSKGALTIAFASLPEAQADRAEARAAELVAQGARGAVITLGARGSLALIGGQTHRAEARMISPVDTTGAGDAYIAGFLTARLNGAPVPTAMAAGHACAAACCGHPGGFPQ